jgi:putative endonuclease
MYAVYIMASGRNGTLYIGQTHSLSRRVCEHRDGSAPGFTTTYGVKLLVYYEYFEGREAAFVRERAMKKWYRIWKRRLIESVNPEWSDLFDTLPPE